MEVHLWFFSLQNLPVTRIVDDFLESREPNTPEGDYLYFDPKQMKVTDVSRSKTPFYEAIVFIVGGGNYIEYQNLVDYCKVGHELDVF